jgi:hypothetical protein
VITKLSREIASPLPESHGMTTSTPVVIGSIDSIYSSRITHFSSERLLDVLNKGSIGDQPELPLGFLQFYDTQIYRLNELQNTTTSNCLISKNSIQFVAEQGPPEMSDSRVHQGKLGLFTPKKGISVEIRLSSFKVTGFIYIELWQRLLSALNDGRRFIPVTGASISYNANVWAAAFQFVAVNQGQINSVSKLE